MELLTDALFAVFRLRPPEVVGGPSNSFNTL
jgi:hypothetical protein